MPRTRLTALDASFLRVETPSAHMHVAWKGRFRPRPGAAPLTLDALRASVAARLRHTERFRQRLAHPPAGLGEPVWVDDELFRIEYHVSPLAEDDQALSSERFDALADLVLSEPLDHRRALWRIFLAPRLQDGTLGVVMKIHHAMSTARRPSSSPCCCSTSIRTRRQSSVTRGGRGVRRARRAWPSRR
jgi:diacylglycerol O-acyltransferase / wax synthase